MTVQFKVDGKVTQSDRSPLSSMTVRAFDKGLPSLRTRGEQQLGDDAVTDTDGSYVISFSEEDFQRGTANWHGKLRPDLFIRAFDGGTVLGESTVYFNAPPETHIDLTVEIPERSEYEAIVHALTPSLRSASIAALTDEDIGFLLGQNGVGESRLYQQSALLGVKIDKDQLELLRQSAQYAQQTKIAAEAFYGWGRMLGASLTPDDLSQSTEAHLRRGLSEAIDQKIIPGSLLAQIDA